MTRKLKNHPALMGESVASAWKRHRDELLKMWQHYRLIYPRLVQRHKMILAWVKQQNELNKRQHLDWRYFTYRPQTPVESERRSVLVPIWPLNYLV